MVQKFDIGISSFLSTYSKDIDKDDEKVIKLHIDDLREKLGEGKGYLTKDKYTQLENVISEITRISNKIRVLSRGRLLSLTMELQKIGSA